MTNIRTVAPKHSFVNSQIDWSKRLEPRRTTALFNRQDFGISADPGMIRDQIQIRFDRDGSEVRAT